MKRNLTLRKYSILLVSVTLIVVLNKCSIEGADVGIKTKAAEPHIAWNGSNFGVVYYAGQVMSYPVNLSMALLDNTGILKKEIKVGGIKPDYKFPGRLSDLIWNDKHKQFAFAYATSDKIWFFRYDANLNPIGVPYVLSQDPGDLLMDISMTYNKDLDEYGLAFICRTNIPADKQHIFFAHFNPSTGLPKGNYTHGWTILIKGTGITGTEKTSICYDSKNKKYAIAYYNDKKASVRFFSSPSMGAGFPITTKTVSPECINIVYDSGPSDFMVLQVDKSGNLSGNVVSPKGIVEKPFYWQNKIDRKLCVSTILPNENHKYVVAVSEGDEVKSYLINDSGIIDKNLPVPSSSKYSYEPSIAVVGATSYLVWIQDKQLYFGEPKLKF